MPGDLSGRAIEGHRALAQQGEDWRGQVAPIECVGRAHGGAILAEIRARAIRDTHDAKLTAVLELRQSEFLPRCDPQGWLLRGIAWGDVSAMRVLMVEDNSTYADLVVARLARSGLDADLVQSVREAEDAISRMEYAAIILDLGLPDQDGLDLLKSIRARQVSTPVIVVTARNSLESRVTGLRLGADDYLAKPFSIDELVARVYALLRRPGQQLGQVLTAGNVLFDSVVRQVVIDGQVQSIRLRELAVLELLMRHKSRAVGRRIFEDMLFGLEIELESNALDVYIHRLRKQLADAGATVTIHTIRGVGYMLSEYLVA